MEPPALIVTSKIHRMIPPSDIYAIQLASQVFGLQRIITHRLVEPATPHAGPATVHLPTTACHARTTFSLISQP
jgi:hypothetical protein